MTDTRTRLKAEADAALQRYVASPQPEREHAWRLYVHAEDKLQQAEHPDLTTQPAKAA